MRRFSVLLLCTVLAIPVSASAQAPPDQPGASEPSRAAAFPTLAVRRQVGGLATPWDVQQLPKGRLLISERDTRRLAIAVAVGDPAEEILKQSVECESDLIVIGTQGLEGAERLVFGSTTERVLRESKLPVLAVPLASA